MYPVIQYTFIYTYCYDLWKINVLIKPYDSQNCKSFAEAIFLVIKYKTLMSLVKFVSGELRCFVEYLVCRMLGWYSRDCRVTWPARGGMRQSIVVYQNQWKPYAIFVLPPVIVTPSRSCYLDAVVGFDHWVDSVSIHGLEHLFLEVLHDISVEGEWD